MASSRSTSTIMSSSTGDTTDSLPVSDSDLNDDECSSPCTRELRGAPKKKRYCQMYRKQWEAVISWLTASRKGDQYGFCTVCKKHLSCTEGGLKDLKRHGESEGHIRQVFMSTWSVHESMYSKAARAEAIPCNMVVEHNLPFLLMDHLPALIVHAFPDSKIAKEVKCARTKSTAVIAPAMHKAMIADVLVSPAFSLMMDESTDRGEQK